MRLGVRAAIPAQREEGNAVCLDRARTIRYIYHVLPSFAPYSGYDEYGR